jgi:hypothetical protein
LKSLRIKKEKVNYFLILAAILITAKGNIITISNITLVIMTFLTGYIFFIRKTKFDKSFYIFTMAYFLLILIYYYKFQYIDLRGLREYIKFLYAYMLIKLVYKNFLKIYSDIVYKLALISIPLFIFQLIDYDLMKSIIGIIEHNIPFLDYRGDWYENIFFFTLNDNGMYRNSGFAWEPKGFGTFLILAIFFRLILNNFKILDKVIITLLIALITTFSTASLSVLFFAVLPFYLYNKNVSYKIIASSILFPMVIGIFFNTQFLKDKIVEEYNTRDKFVSYVDDKNYQGKTRSLGRFGSLIVDYNDFKKEPIIGYGLYSNERTMYSAGGVKLVRVNGFSDFLAKFGIIGILFLILSLSISFKKLTKLYKFKGYFFISLGILLMSFASAILLTPIYLALMLFSIIKIKRS